MDSRPFALLQELAAREPIVLRVRGDCMAPVLPAGAAVTVRRRPFYFPGDVLIFRSAAGDLVAHRLLGYRRSGGHFAFVTQGDHCHDHDAPILPANVIGCASGIHVAVTKRGAAVGRFVRLLLRRVRR